MLTMNFPAFGRFISDIRSNWPVYLITFGMISTPLYMSIRWPDASQSQVILAMLAWVVIPLVWAIMALILSNCFPRELDPTYDPAGRYDSSKPMPRKKKVMLWLAPVSLPYYTLKRLAVWLAGKVWGSGPLRRA